MAKQTRKKLQAETLMPKMTTTRRRNTFTKQHGSTFTCDSCGRRTRNTGAQSMGSTLCPQCFDLAGIENTISDEGDSVIADYRDQALALLDSIRANGGNPDQSFTDLIATLAAPAPAPSPTVDALTYDPLNGRRTAITEVPCVICGVLCSTHDDAAHPLAQCGDCGGATCEAHRDETSATRCTRCAAAYCTACAQHRPCSCDDAVADSYRPDFDTRDREGADLAEDYPGQRIDGPDLDAEWIADLDRIAGEKEAEARTALQATVDRIQAAVSEPDAEWAPAERQLRIRAIERRLDALPLSALEAIFAVVDHFATRQGKVRS